MITAPDRIIRILLAEDSPGDAELTRFALEQGTIASELSVARDGVEAIEMLRDPEHPRPDLVLLDLNMPRMNGSEVLEEMKADPELRAIPVVVLTTSSSPADISRSYSLHVNCYVRKPIDFDEFLAVMRSIEDFWLSTVELPQAA